MIGALAVDVWAVTRYIWYSEEKPVRAAAPPSSLLAVPNVTAYQSTASEPTSYYSMWQSNAIALLSSLSYVTYFSVTLDVSH